MRRSKFRNVKTVVDGFTFDSQREAKRYCELKLLQRCGSISGLTCQFRFKLTSNGELLKIRSKGFPGGRVATYVADFTYTENGKDIIEDVKGMKTPVYLLKRAIMESMGYEIRET